MDPFYFLDRVVQFFDASSVAATFKFGLQEGSQAISRHVESNGSTAETDNVGIIV